MPFTGHIASLNSHLNHRCDKSGSLVSNLDLLECLLITFANFSGADFPIAMGACNVVCNSAARKGVPVRRLCYVVPTRGQ